MANRRINLWLTESRSRCRIRHCIDAHSAGLCWGCVPRLWPHSCHQRRSRTDFGLLRTCCNRGDELVSDAFTDTLAPFFIPSIVLFRRKWMMVTSVEGNRPLGASNSLNRRHNEPAEGSKVAMLHPGNCRAHWPAQSNFDLQDTWASKGPVGI